MKSYEELLKDNNQEHILKYIEMAKEDQKEKMIEQINNIDFEQLKDLYKESKKTDFEQEKNIEHVDYTDKEKLNKERYDELKKIGADIIKSGKYAVV